MCYLTRNTAANVLIPEQTFPIEHTKDMRFRLVILIFINTIEKSMKQKMYILSIQGDQKLIFTLIFIASFLILSAISLYVQRKRNFLG